MVVLARGGGAFEDLLPFSDERLVRAVAACPVPVVSAVGHEQDTPLVDLAADVRASTPSVAGRLVVPDLAELNAWLERAHGRLERGARRVVERQAERLATTHDRLRRAPLLALERRRARLDRTHGRLLALSPRATLERGYAIVRAGERARPRAAAGRDRARGRGRRRLVRGARRMSAEPTFEQQQAELERIVERLERGDVGLDELTKLWERGEELYRRLSEQLAGAQGKIEELARRLGDDAPARSRMSHGHDDDRSKRTRPPKRRRACGRAARHLRSCFGELDDDAARGDPGAARRGRRAPRPR